jgi:hypothetical protein
MHTTTIKRLGSTSVAMDLCAIVQVRCCVGEQSMNIGLITVKVVVLQGMLWQWPCSVVDQALLFKLQYANLRPAVVSWPAASSTLTPTW